MSSSFNIVRDLPSTATYGWLVVFVLLVLTAPAHATFSIVAVDTVTGALGSAGASCIGNSDIISGIAPGFGVVHTQAWWNPANKRHADSLIKLGLTPDSIISWLANNDAENDGFDADYRQYGVVTLAGPGASAGYTGIYTDFWRGHLTGPTYAIQGNILLDSSVVYDMETAYLTTPGPLEDRLMAALEAAKRPGADSRCLSDGKSAISAFIKVSHPGDGDTPYLDEVVSTTTGSTDPIDVLHDQYNAWKAAQVADADLTSMAVDPTALPATGFDDAVVTVIPLNAGGVPPTHGAIVTLSNSGGGTLSAVTDNGDNTYTATLTSPATIGRDTVHASVEAGGQIVEVTQVATMLYFLCGDANFDGSVTSADIIYMVSHIFKGGFRPEPVPEVGDVNRDGNLTSADIIYLVNYVFKSGPAPCP